MRSGTLRNQTSHELRQALDSIDRLKCELHLSVAEMIDDDLGWVASGIDTRPQNRCQLARGDVSVFDWCQIKVEDAIRKFVHELSRDSDGKTALADPARPGHCRQGGLDNQCRESSTFGLSIDEFG